MDARSSHHGMYRLTSTSLVPCVQALHPSVLEMTFHAPRQALTCLFQAEEALLSDEVPVGCVFVKQGQAIARARNRTNEWRNATLHAELEAIDHLLPNHPAPLSSITLYVTVEPCVMCASALRQIGIGKVVYGCGNDRFGGCGSVIDVNASFVFPFHDLVLTFRLMDEVGSYWIHILRSSLKEVTIGKKPSCCLDDSTCPRIRTVRLVPLSFIHLR